MKLISTIDRIAAWILAFSILLYIISGFDIQTQFFSPPLSSSLHLIYLFPVAQVAFMFHTTYAIHLAFIRWNIWNVLGKSLLTAYLLLNACLLYLYLSIYVFG